MNELTLNNNQNTATMTSLQIAELTSKRHDNVKRTIETLINTGVIAQPQFEEMLEKVVNNREYKVNAYIFEGKQGKRDSLVVVAQIMPEVTAQLVDRWTELEEQLANPVAALPNFTNPAEAAIAWAEQYKAKEEAQLQVAALEHKVEEDKEKVQFFEALGNTNQLYAITKAASNHGISGQALNKVFREGGIYDTRFREDDVFKGDFITKGYGEMKLRNGGHTQPMLTEKGLKWLAKTLYQPIALKTLEGHYHSHKKLPLVYRKNLAAQAV